MLFLYRYKNSTYQSQLRSEKLKSSQDNTYQIPEEMISNVKTEIVEDFEIVPTDDDHDEIGKKHALKKYDQFALQILAAFVGEVQDQILP